MTIFEVTGRRTAKMNITFFVRNRVPNTVMLVDVISQEVGAIFNIQSGLKVSSLLRNIAYL